MIAVETRPTTQAAYKRQAEACYLAEAILPTWSRRFRTVEEAQAYAVSVIHSDWFDEEFDTNLQDIDITEYKRFKKHAGDAWRSGTIGMIRLKSFSQNVILHELAHCINDWDDAHGPVFCGIMLRLVRREMGFHAYGALLAAYTAFGCLEVK